jgi:hypothetical protein
MERRILKGGSVGFVFMYAYGTMVRCAGGAAVHPFVRVGSQHDRGRSGCDAVML